MNNKKRGSHKVATKYVPNAILYYILQFFKGFLTLDSRDVQGLVLMALIWAIGAVTGGLWAVMIFKM